MILEEFGVTSDYVSDPQAADYYRHVLHNTLLAGATGWLSWNNTDYDDLFDVEPYSHHPFEMHFGLIDKFGRPKAQALEVKSFSETLERVEAGALSRPDAQAVLVVSSYLEAQYPFTQPEDAAAVFEISRQLTSQLGKPTFRSACHANSTASPTTRCSISCRRPNS